MSVTVPNVPPYEMQVLEILRILSLSPFGDITDPDYDLVVDIDIALRGENNFGGDWPGERRGTVYFKVNAALGRLSKKGFVEREDGPAISGWGYWRLTPLGRDLMGLEPLNG